jgi:hypothetical protein
MSIDLDDQLVEALERLASSRGRDVAALIDEAVRDYLTSAEFPEITPEQLSVSQMAVLPELDSITPREHEASERPDAAG